MSIKLKLFLISTSNSLDCDLPDPASKLQRNSSLAGISKVKLFEKQIAPVCIFFEIVQG